MDNLRGVLIRTGANAHYWYELWHTTSIQFHQGQEILVGEIDRLRKKHGEYDGESHLDKLHDEYLEKMKDKWVEPEEHPVPGIDVRDDQPVDDPPLQPADLLELADEIRRDGGLDDVPIERLGSNGKD